MPRINTWTYRVSFDSIGTHGRDVSITMRAVDFVKHDPFTSLYNLRSCTNIRERDCRGTSHIHGDVCLRRRGFPLLFFGVEFRIHVCDYISCCIACRGNDFSSQHPYTSSTSSISNLRTVSLCRIVSIPRRENFSDMWLATVMNGVTLSETGPLISIIYCILG